MLSKLNGGRFQVTCCTSSRTRASAKGWRSRRIRGRENSPRRESGTRPLTWWAFRRERRYYSWMRSSGGEHDANQALDRVQSAKLIAKLAFLFRTRPKRQLQLSRTSPTHPSHPRHHLCTDHTLTAPAFEANWTLEANPATLSLGLSGCASKPTHAQQSLDASFGHSSHSSSPVSLTSSADLASDLR